MNAAAGRDLVQPVVRRRKVTSQQTYSGVAGGGENHCQWSRPDQRVATGSGVTEPQDSLGIACPSSLNRRMRTRMSGGVGRAPSTGALTRFGHPFPAALAVGPIDRPSYRALPSPNYPDFENRDKCHSKLRPDSLN
jgi:hypothetical protein